MNKKETISYYQKLFTIFLIIFGLSLLALLFFVDGKPATIYSYMVVASTVISLLVAVILGEKGRRLMLSDSTISKPVHCIIPIAPIGNMKHRTVLGAIPWEEVAIVLKKTKNVPSKATVCEIRTHEAGLILIVELAI